MLGGAFIFLIAFIVGSIGFLIWAIFHPKQAPAKFQEILMSLDDFWHDTKEKLREWRTGKKA